MHMENEINEQMKRQRLYMWMRRQALRQMTADLQHLVDSEAGTAEWHRTKRDLVELIHVVWQQQTIIDEQGYRASQLWLARRAFRAVGWPEPKPSRLTSDVWAIGRRRSRRRSLLSCYEQLALQRPALWDHHQSTVNHQQHANNETI